MRKLPILLASLMLLSCTACGDSDDDNGGRDSRLNGEYCTIVPINGTRMTEDMSLDKYLTESRVNYKNLPFKELVFDGNDFEMSNITSMYVGSATVYSGSYKVSDGKLHFNYKTTTVDNHGEVTVYNIKDDESNAEGNENVRAGLIKLMNKFNETGTFYTYVGNRMDFSDRYVAYNVMPVVVQNVMSGNKNNDVPVYLYTMDDLICVPTYGTELDGSYKYGKDFTIVYNALDTYLDDEYSRYYINGWDKDSEKTENMRSSIESQLGSTDDTKIEFSDGKWKWYNSAGELINDGIYKESEEYKGLIAMFVTEESANPDKDFITMSPEFLYLDDSGKIWIPYMMKAN